ncbi:MAG: type II toxin-antitoxin system RelE/ParE family toxin [Acetobacteraceae bacterium]
MPLAAAQVRLILLESAKCHGEQAAVRYSHLLLATFQTVGERPDTAGATNLLRFPGVRAFPARLVRDRLAPEHRVRSPRHIVLYRVAPDGVVDILAVIHDRMLLSRAAGRAVRAANS